MAKKRLNKKVALIGSLIFVFLVLGTISAVLYLNRDPDRFIEDGDAAVEAARTLVDEQEKAEEYKRAESNYRQAHGLAGTDSEKVKVLFRLADLYIETDQWPDVMKCWNGIVQIDPRDVRARFGRLKYMYIMGDSGLRGAWQEVVSQASELIEIAQAKNLFAADTAQWDPFVSMGGIRGLEKLGPYLYLLRGRGNVEIAKMGASPDPGGLLNGAMEDLKKVQELEPTNVEVYAHMAMAALASGEILTSKGDYGARERATAEVRDYLEQGIKLASDDPKPQIMLLSMKLSAAKSSQASVIEEEIFSLEPEYVSLVEKYPSSAAAFSALAGFYELSLPNLDKAIEAAEKAVELDEENVRYLRGAASLHYTKFCIYGEKAHLDKATLLVRQALTLPEAQDKPGPRQWANRMNRVLLFTFLAEYYIEQILEQKGSATEAQAAEWYAEAEQAVNEVKELLGTGEEPQAVKWRGMLDLARGDTKSATKLMYNAYEQLKSVERKDSLLSYRLAKIFENTGDVGAVKEFYVSALSRPGRIDEKKPEALLDYGNLLLRLGDYNGALSVADFFERKYWSNERSSRLRMNAYIGGGQLDKVEEELAKRDPDDPNKSKLQLTLLGAKIRRGQRAIARVRLKGTTVEALQELEMPTEAATEPESSVEVMTDELKAYWGQLAELVEKLLTVEPNSVSESSVVAVCSNYIAEGKVTEAKALVGKFLVFFPDSTAVGLYRRMLSEPNPGEISQERRKELEEEVLSAIPDTLRRGIELGKFYHSHNELDNAATEFHKVFDLSSWEDEAGVPGAELTDLERLAVSYLFEIALANKDWELAGRIEAIARRQDMDQCAGSFFAARHALVKGAATEDDESRKEVYAAGLAEINRCLKEKPVFSHGLLVRSNISAATGDEHLAISDAQKAASLNPMDGTIAKNLAFVLYKRDKKLGDNVTSDQTVETKSALVRALRTNPGDLQLLGFYAEYISSTEPAKALAISQHLQRAVPSLQNALRLGRLAMRMAGEESDSQVREALSEIARSSFDEAIAMAPEDRTALRAKAQYLRFADEPEKARELLEKAGADELLWTHYVGLGRFEDAKRVLERLYERDPGDGNVLRGLLMVAEQTGDKEGVKRYSEELLSADGSVDSRLLQIQTYLKAGLVKDAENSLERFKEQYRREGRVLLLEAWLAMRRGQLEKALELTNQNLQGDEENGLAWQIRGQINLLMGKQDQAIADFKKSKLLMDEPATRYYLARAYVQAGRMEDAITELENAIDYAENLSRGTPLGRGPRELLERIYLRLDRRAALGRFYDETLQRFPDDAGWHNRAGAFAVKAGDFDRAVQLYKRAMEAAGDRQEEKGTKVGRDQFSISLDGYLRALVLGAGRPNTAGWNPAQLNRVFEEGRKYADDDYAAIAYFRMGEAKMKLGDKATATQYCRTALDKASAPGTDESLASLILQRMYLLLGEEEVRKYCEQALVTDPDSLAANFALFNLMKVSAEYNKALGHIDKCLEVVGAEDARRLSYVLSKVDVLTLAYLRTSDNSYLERAVSEYESLLAEMPNNTTVLNNLAYLLAENGERLPEALKHAVRACELAPNNAGSLDTYAYVLYKHGRYSEADASLQSALQLYEQGGAVVPAEVYEHLGMVKEELGAPGEAAAAYKQALEAGADELSDSVRERIVSAIKRLSGQE